MELLTSDEVAAELTISVKTVRRMIRCMELPSYRIGGCRRVSREDLDAYLAAQRLGEPVPVNPYAPKPGVERPCLYKPGMKVV